MGNKFSLIDKFRRFYDRLIYRFVKFLRKHCNLFGLVTATFLTEPLSALRSGIMLPYGWKRHFNYYGLNPKSLTKEQLAQDPVLLIHGNFDNQRAWLRLAQKLQDEGIPAFTVNLPSGKITRRDKDLLEKKWAEIRNLYRDRDDLLINVVGHSRGACLAVMMGVNIAGWSIGRKGRMSTDLSTLRKRRDIGKIIQIAQHFVLNDFQNSLADSVKIDDRIYTIRGSRDVLAPLDDNFSESSRKFVYEFGHLGLLFSDEVDQKIIEILKNR
jgi:hypothetical protein